EDLTVEEGLRWLWLASSDAAELWDDESWSVLSARHVDMARAAGALSVLPLTLHSQAVAHVLAGELDAAASLVAELDAVQPAAARADQTELAADAFERLEAITRVGGTDWALGIQARAHALLSDADAAERLYREAIERLGRTRLRGELARTRLLYGEWLRRENR